MAVPLPPTASSYSFLHLTDIHCAYGHLELVKEYLKENPRKVDFILSSGDLTNMNPADNEDDGKVRENEEEVVKVLRALQEIHPLVYFIPGNHDAKTYFSGEGKEIPSAINLHGRHLRLCSDLVISSFGGSVPAQQGGKPCWTGFPFEDDKGIEEGLTKLLQAESAIDNSTDEPTAGDSILLMTHIGPVQSATAIQQIDLNQQIITTGSDSLDRMLREERQQKRVFMNIHGHTHFGEGVTKIGDTFIVNPGSVGFKAFGIVNIKRNEKKGMWQYKSVEIVQL